MTICANGRWWQRAQQVRWIANVVLRVTIARESRGCCYVYVVEEMKSVLTGGRRREDMVDQLGGFRSAMGSSTDLKLTTGSCSRMKEKAAHSLELMRRQGLERAVCRRILPAFGVWRKLT